MKFFTRPILAKLVETLGVVLVATARLLTIWF